MKTGCSLYPALRDQEGRCHGARHGETEEPKEYFIAFIAWKTCRKRELTLKKNITQGIHDRFQRDQVYRESQRKIDWTEQKCTEMDKLAQEDHPYHLSNEEFKRFQGQWYLTLNKAGKNAPMRLRSDFRAAVSTKNRLHQETVEGLYPTPHIHEQMTAHIMATSTATLSTTR